MVLAWLLGVRTAEGPESVRVTFPRWMVKFMPDLLERLRGDMQRAHPESEIRIVGRSIITRM